MRRARADGRLCRRRAVLLRALPFFVDRVAIFVLLLCDVVVCDAVFFVVLCRAEDELLCVVADVLA